MEKQKIEINAGNQPWIKFRKNKPAIIGLAWIILALFTAILGYIITPDATPWANRQTLELTTLRPGVKVHMLKIRKNSPDESQNIFQTLLAGKTDEYDFVPFNSYKFNQAQIILEKYSEPGDSAYLEQSFSLSDVVYSVKWDQPSCLDSLNNLHFETLNGEKLTVPLTNLKREIKENQIITKTFWLGTDIYGRDLLSRLLIGTRVSLSVGFIAVLISLIIGVSLGATAGYFGGKTDQLIMWLINVIWSVPTLLLVIAITMVLGKGFWQIFIAVGLTMWVEVARVVRGEVMSIREKEFIEAARVLGYSNTRIIFRHILPNVYSPVIVTSASNFASAILVEAGLSFLGIGVQPPMPSWGSMIKEHYGYIIMDKAYLALVPGVAIMLMVLAFILVGNGLRDAFDSRDYSGLQ